MIRDGLFTTRSRDCLLAPVHLDEVRQSEPFLPGMVCFQYHPTFEVFEVVLPGRLQAYFQMRFGIRWDGHLVGIKTASFRDPWMLARTKVTGRADRSQPEMKRRPKTASA